MQERVEEWLRPTQHSQAQLKAKSNTLSEKSNFTSYLCCSTLWHPCVASHLPPQRLLLSQTLPRAQSPCPWLRGLRHVGREGCPSASAALPRTQSLVLCPWKKSELRSEWNGYFGGAEPGWPGKRRDHLWMPWGAGRHQICDIQWHQVVATRVWQCLWHQNLELISFWVLDACILTANIMKLEEDPRLGDLGLLKQRFPRYGLTLNEFSIWLRRFSLCWDSGCGTDPARVCCRPQGSCLPSIQQFAQIISFASWETRVKKKITLCLTWIDTESLQSMCCGTSALLWSLADAWETRWLVMLHGPLGIWALHTSGFWQGLRLEQCNYSKRSLKQICWPNSWCFRVFQIHVPSCMPLQKNCQERSLHRIEQRWKLSSQQT